MGLNFVDYITKVENDKISHFFETTDINIIGYGNWKETDIRELKEFITPSFQLTYIKKGKASISYDSKELFFEAGTAFIYIPFKVYSAESVGEESLEYSYIFFDIYPFAQRYKLEQYILTENNSYFNEMSKKLYRYQFENLEEAVNAKRPGSTYTIKLSLLTILTEMMAEMFETIPFLEHEKDLLTLVQQAIKYTDENLSNPININRIARELGVSESLLSKSFQKAVHLSPAKFLTRYKIGIAEQYLRQRNYSVEIIAERLGYSSGAHLRTTYKKTLGRNP